MAKKNYTWKLDEDLVSKIQQLAEKEHRSLTNYIEVMLIEKSQSVAVGGKKSELPTHARGDGLGFRSQHSH